MSYKKIIKEVLGIELEKLGFEFIEGNTIIWPYRRKKGDVIQEITVIRERYEKGYIKMIFWTNAYGQNEKELGDFIPGELPEYWKYNSMSEFKKIIEQFKNWTLTYGLDELEKMSVPTTDARPKPETNRYLLEHHEELNEKYLKLLNMESANTVTILIEIQKKIEELKSSPFSEVEETLIGLAAVWGHAMCLFNVGDWVWSEDLLACVILNIGDSDTMSFNPLREVIFAYSHKNNISRYMHSYYCVAARRNSRIEHGQKKGEIEEWEKALYDAFYKESDLDEESLKVLRMIN